MIALGVLLAALAEAIVGTAVAPGRADLLADLHATPDELAWLDIAYTATKLIGFLVTPGLVNRIDARRLVVGSTLAMGAACAIAALTTRLDLMVAMRLLQGLSGGALLVAGQAMLFIAYPRHRQPILQALFAMGSVVAPAAIAPFLQGWLVDHHSWTWIFAAVVPLALAAAGVLLFLDPAMPIGASPRPFDSIGFSLAATAILCLTYVLSQGQRWGWLEEPRIAWAATLGVASLAAFVVREWRAGGAGLLDLTPFRSADFLFAFLVSFVAGAALFGSAFLIPSFAISTLAFTAAEAGELLLWGSVPFVGALLLAALLMQARGMPPIATVPFGILAIMLAMWMLSGSTGASGVRDMAGAIVLRGLGLGFLFLSITLIAFGRLHSRNLASGIGLFNTGRQLGGLIGVGGLQSLIEDEVAANLNVLGAHVTAGTPAVTERLAATASRLVAQGMDPDAAARAAASLLGRAVSGQSTIIAFDTAFNAVALLFVCAAPVLIALKAGLARHAARTRP